MQSSWQQLVEGPYDRIVVNILSVLQDNKGYLKGSKGVHADSSSTVRFILSIESCGLIMREEIHG
jgi:hypothetical protein